MPRLTAHNGRHAKGRVYNNKHNDRQFNVDNSEHIDSSRTKNNIYINFVDDSLSFAEGELQFYEEHFSQSLSEKNERYERNRHREHIQTMKEYLNSEKTCPEETIIQLGRKDDDHVDPDILLAITLDQIKWEQKQYPQCHYLNIALHLDEATTHIHARRVWIGHDNNYNECVGQAKALREMNVDPPDPTKKITAYNNSKMTYTRECREHLIELCRQYGIEIETQPLEPSETGLSLTEYKVKQEQSKLYNLQEQAERQAIDNAMVQQYAEDELRATSIELENNQAKINAQKAEYSKIRTAAAAEKDTLKDLRQHISTTLELTQKVKPIKIGKDRGKIAIDQATYDILETRQDTIIDELDRMLDMPANTIVLNRAAQTANNEAAEKLQEAEEKLRAANNMLTNQQQLINARALELLEDVPKDLRAKYDRAIDYMNQYSVKGEPLGQKFERDDQEFIKQHIARVYGHDMWD